VSRIDDEAPYKKKAIPLAVRRAVALKYGCEPGESATANCHRCGVPGGIYWERRYSGEPSYWVTFDHELDHLVPEARGGLATVENIVLACRPCNRSKGAKV
jgi:5-methylcytosine-specific restriction endonuclease McrA